MKLGTKSRFFDASMQLYRRLCPSVGPSVGLSVGLSVRQVFFFSKRRTGGPIIEGEEGRSRWQPKYRSRGNSDMPSKGFKMGGGRLIATF